MVLSESTHSFLLNLYGNSTSSKDLKILPTNSKSRSRTYVCNSVSSPLRFFLKQSDLNLKTGSRYNKSEGFVDSISRHSIENEYLNLKTISELIDGVPEPFAFISEDNLIIMEYIKHNQLSKKFNNILWNPFSRINTIKKHLDLVLLWLTNFEDKFFVGETKKMDFYVSLISSKIENISFFSDSQKRKGTSYLKFITDKIDSFPTIITNKDFKAHNILSDGNEMYVVDWEMVDHNSYIFWMPCAFIRTLSYDFFRSYFHNKKFEALENYFMSKYLELTPLKNLKNYLPLSSFFDLVIALSESPESINKEYPRGALIASIRRYNKLING